MPLSKQEALPRVSGCNAEETTALVDYKDKDRLREFLSVCELTNESLYVLKEYIKSLDDLSDDQETLFDYAQKDFVRAWLHLQRHGFLRLNMRKTILLMKACATNSATLTMTIF